MAKCTLCETDIPDGLDVCLACGTESSFSLENVAGGRAQAMRAVETAKQGLAMEKAQGLDSPLGNRLVGNAQASLDSNRYAEALALAKAARRSLEIAKRRERLRKAQDDIEAMVEEARRLEAETGPAESALESAKKCMMQNKFRGAESHFKQARNLLIKARQAKDLRTLIRSAREAVDRAEAKGVDTSRAKECLDQALEAFRAKQFDFVREKSREAARIAEDSWKVAKAESIISKAARELEAAARVGVRTKEARRCLNEARVALKSGALEDVGPKVNAMRETLKEARKDRDAELLINGVAISIRREERRGTDVVQAREALERSRAALEAKQYQEVRLHVKEAETQLRDAVKVRKFKHTIATILDEIEELRRIDADSSDVEIAVAEARKALDARNFETVRRFINMARRVAEDARLVKQKEAVLEAFQKILERAGGRVDAEEAKRLLAEVEMTVAMGQTVDVDALISQRLNLVDTGRVQALSERMIRLKEALLSLRRMNVDISGAEEMIARIRYAMDTGNLQEAEVLLRQVEDLAFSLRSAMEDAARDLIERARTSVERAKAMGLPVPDAERLLASALDAQERHQTYEATEFARVALERAEGAIRKHEEESRNRGVESLKQQAEKVHEIRERLLRVHETAEDLAEIGVEITAVREALGNARRCLDKKQLVEAEAYAKAAEDMANSLREALRKKAEDCVAEARRLFSDSAARGLSTPEMEVLLHHCEQAFEGALYRNCLESFDALRDVVDRIERERAVEERRKQLDRARKASDRFVRVKKMVDELKTAAIDLMGAEEILRQAQLHLSRKDYDAVDEILSPLEESCIEVKDEFSAAAHYLLGRAKDMVAKAQHLKLNSAQAENYVLNAEENLRRGDVDDAIELACLAEHSARSQVSRHEESLKVSAVQEKERAQAELLRTRKTLEDLRKADIEIVGASHIMHKAEEALDQGRYPEVYSNLREVEALAESLVEGLKSAAEDLLERARLAMEEAKAEDLDIARAAHVFLNAREAVMDRRFVEAIEYQKVIKDIVSDSKRQRSLKLLAQRFSKLKVQCQLLRTKGLDMSGVSDDIASVEEDFATGRTEGLEVAVNEIEARIAASVDAYIANELRRLGQAIELAKKEGADTSTAEAILKDAEEAGARGEIQALSASEKRIESAIAEARGSLLKSKMQEDVGALERELEEAASAGVAVALARESLRSAMDAVERGDIASAEKSFQESRARLEEGRRQQSLARYQNKVHSIETVISSAKQSGADVAEAERMLVEACEALNHGDESLADMLLKQAEVLAGLQIQNFIRDKYPNLTVNLPSKGLQAGIWNKYAMELENRGRLAARNIEIEFDGDVDVKGLEVLSELEVDERRKLEVGLRPKAEGSIPLAMRLFYQRPFDENRYEIEKTQQLQVEAPGTYVVEDAFLVHSDGRLIAHQSRKFREEIDEDIFSGMLTVVQEFVKDSFKQRTKLGLKRMDFGDSKILIERSPNTYVAAVILGKEPRLLPLYMVEILREIEDKYGSVLEHWNGLLNQLAGIEDIIKKLVFVSERVEAEIGELKESPITNTVRILEMAREEGADINDIEALIAAAHSSLERDTESAWKFLEQANEKARLTEGRVKQSTKELIEKAEEAVQVLSELGEDVSQSELLLQEARAAILESRYAKVREIFDRIQGALEHAMEASEKRKLQETLKELLSEIARGSSEGIEISSAKAYVPRIEQALRSDDLEEQRELLRLAKAALEEDRKRSRANRLRQEIEAVIRMISEAKQFGIQVEDSEQMIRKAEEDFAQGKYEGLESLITAARTTAAERVKEQIKERYPRIFLESSIAALQSDDWNRLELEIVNKGNWPAKNLNVACYGDADIKGLRNIEILEPTQMVTMELGVRPKTPGMKSLDFEVSYERPLDDTKYEVAESTEVMVHIPSSYPARDAILFHADGRLIVHESGRYRAADEREAFAKIIEAVKDFIDKAYKENTDIVLRRGEVGAMRAIVERSPNTYLALVLEGDEPALLPLFAADVLREIEEGFGHRLENWSGRIEDLKGISALLRKLLFASDLEGAELGPLEEGMVAKIPKLQGEGVLHGEGDKSFIETVRARLEGATFEEALAILRSVQAVVAGPTRDLGVELREAVVATGRGAGMELTDEQIQQYVEEVRRVLEAVSRAKQQADIADHWPVRRVAAKPFTQLGYDALASFRKLIVQRTKAKELDIVGPSETWRGMKIDLEVDFEVVSQAYKLWAKKIEIMLRSQDAWKIKMGMEKGEYSLGIEGQKVKIESDMVKFYESLPENVLEVGYDGGVVYLDTEADDAILGEAYAIEVARTVEDLKAQASLSKDAEVDVGLRCGTDLKVLLQLWTEYIREQTQSAHVDFVTEPAEEAYTAEIGLGDESLEIQVRVVDRREKLKAAA